MATLNPRSAPGVSIVERDLSLRAELAATTNNVIIGYASQGPTEEVIYVSNMSEFEDIFGSPTNAAERYFYYSVKHAFEGPGQIAVARIPYGAETGSDKSSDYSALVYPVMPIPAVLSAESPATVLSAGTDLRNAQAFYFGEPVYHRLTETQYEDYKAGQINWAVEAGQDPELTNLANIGNAGLIIINKARVKVDNAFEGFYIGIADNDNFNPATHFDSIENAYTITSTNPSTYKNIPLSRLAFQLSSENDQSINYTRGSTSELIEQIPNFTIGSSSFKDVLTVATFKLRPSIYAKSETALDQVYTEGFFGSFNAKRTLQDVNGGSPITFYLKPRINDEAVNIELLINPNISEKSDWTDENGDANNPSKSVHVFKSVSYLQSSSTLSAHADYLDAAETDGWMNPGTNLYTFGVYEPKVPNLANKHIGNLPIKLDRILRLADNADIVPIDIVADAGLSTIWATYKAAVEVDSSLSAAGQFDDELNLDVSELYTSDGQPISGTISDSWEVVYSMFEKFAQFERRDHIFISDPLRQLLVQGEDSKVIKRKDRNFSQHIYWGLRNLYQGSNSSYTTMYANWIKIYDGFSDKFFWCPISGKIMGMMNNTDANVAPWSAPAGLNRGILSGVLDIAINPNEKQQGLLYKEGLNPVVLFNRDGYTVWGQKTRLAKPSAFDRINVRRLFLWAEKATLRVMRYFVFEPNSVFTRSRVVNTLTPIFEFLKNNEGVYDYHIECSEKNNTRQVIDNNELRVNIYLKPVRTAEFIIVEFAATRTDQNFQELI